jgi:chaperonin cofactor prefoldin
MEAESLMFTAKDVIGIIMLAVSVLSAYFALKKDIEKATGKIKDLDGQLLHKETIIYKRMSEIKDEQKADHEKLSVKIDTLNQHMNTISTSLAELTGYIKAKKQD